MLLGGLIVWAVHFFALYGIASLFPGTQLARTLSLMATVPAMAANAAILWIGAAGRLRSDDDLQSWILDLGALGAALSLVAVLWQALPAVTV